MSTKPTSYTLIIDKHRNDMLYVVHEMLMRHPISKGLFVARCSELGILSDEIESFLNEWKDKEHEMDWCADPDCKRKKKDSL